MSAGLYPLATVARFLGQRPEEIHERVRHDGLPAITVPTRTKPVLKFSAHALHKWLSQRSTGEVPTLQELRDELDRCAEIAATKRQRPTQDAAA